MKIIVTGGAGFIGSNFVFYMLDEYPEDKIICVDKLTYAGNLSTLASVLDNPNLDFVNWTFAIEQEFISYLKKNIRIWSLILQLNRMLIVRLRIRKYSWIRI